MASSGKRPETEEEKVEIKKSITLLSGSALILGSIVGSGIFVSPKGILMGSGSVGMSLIIWLFCGILSLLTSLTYVELGSVVPEFGGAYTYFLEAFAPNRQTEKKWWKTLPAFMYIWQTSILGHSLTGSILSLIAAEYFVRLGAGGCTNWALYSSPDEAVKLIAVVIILLVVVINAYSIPFALKLQNTLGGAKLLGMGVIIIGGIYRLSTGHTQEFENAWEGTNFTYGDLATAVFSGLFAFGGWGNLNFVVKEMKNPKRDLPLAVIGTNVVVIILYILVNVSYYSALSKNELLASEAVAVSFAGKVAGVYGEVLMILLVASSVFGTMNGNSYTYSRLSYSAAREGHLPVVLTLIHKDYFTPASTIWFNGILSIVMVTASDIFGLISLGGFINSFFAILVMTSLFIFRKTRKDAPRSIKVPLIIPIIKIIFSLILIVMPFLDKPRVEYLYGIAYHCIGVVLYFVFVHYENSISGLGTFTKTVQLLLNVVPESGAHPEQNKGSGGIISVVFNENEEKGDLEVLARSSSVVRGGAQYTS